MIDQKVRRLRAANSAAPVLYPIPLVVFQSRGHVRGGVLRAAVENELLPREVGVAVADSLSRPAVDEGPVDTVGVPVTPGRVQPNQPTALALRLILWTLRSTKD